MAYDTTPCPDSFPDQVSRLSNYGVVVLVVVPVVVLVLVASGVVVPVVVAAPVSVEVVVLVVVLVLVPVSVVCEPLHADSDATRAKLAAANANVLNFKVIKLNRLLLLNCVPC